MLTCSSNVSAHSFPKAPALAQQKSETERFRLENAQLASQLREAISDRDAMSAHMQESNQKYKRSQQENALLNQQLEDLGRQIKALLKELGRRQDATLPSDEDMQSINPADNIEAVITNNLVLYRSIDQLQEQNQRLLKITRDLGARMEKEERDYKDRLELGRMKLSARLMMLYRNSSHNSSKRRDRIRRPSRHTTKIGKLLNS